MPGHAPTPLSSARAEPHGGDRAPILEFRGVERAYESGATEVRALDGVSFTVAPGEFVAITGPSGSGKSTLMHLAGCLDLPTGGEVRVAGQATHALGDRGLAELRRGTVGFVFQAFNLIPRVSALENVILPLSFNGAGLSRGARRARGRDLLESVGLGGRVDHAPGQLSGGERQRVAIARALVNDPSLILADEPTGNLDTDTGAQILDIFNDLHGQGRTLVVVTHDPLVAKAAERELHIRDGRLTDADAPGAAGGWAR